MIPLSEPQHVAGVYQAKQKFNGLNDALELASIIPQRLVVSCGLEACFKSLLFDEPDSVAYESPDVRRTRC